MHLKEYTQPPTTDKPPAAQLAELRVKRIAEIDDEIAILVDANRRIGESIQILPDAPNWSERASQHWGEKINNLEAASLRNDNAIADQTRRRDATRAGGAS